MTSDCRDVSVYRLVSRNTVEEAMLRCAQAKLQLEQDVTGQGAGQSHSLFRSRPISPTSIFTVELSLLCFLNPFYAIAFGNKKHD